MDRRGPNMEPWGTPLLMFIISELVLEKDAN